MKKTLLFLFSLLLLITFFSIKDRTRPTLRCHENTLRLNLPYTPITLDPRVNTDPTTTTLHLMLYEGLTRLKSDGTCELCLAKSYTLSKDKTTYTFHLKKSFFSDGSPLTAFDFESSWKQALSPDFMSRSVELLFCIKNAQKIKQGDVSCLFGVQALDDQTLQITLERPTPYFLQLLSYPTYFPVHPLMASSNKRDILLISNGPFKLQRIVNNDKICLIKNKAFHEASKVCLSKVILDIVPDGMTSFYLFQKGLNHWFGGLLMTLPPDSLKEILNRHILHQKPTTGFTFCALNTHNKLLSNLNIRKALYKAIDPPSLAKQFPILAHKTSTGPTPDSFWKENNLEPIQIVTQEDPLELFKKGLRELGINKQDVPPLTLLYFTSDLYKSIAQIFQEKIQTRLGLPVKLVTTPIIEHYHRLKNQNYDIALTAWISQFNDPINYLERFDYSLSNKNYSGWKSPTFIKLLEKSYTQHNQERAKQLRCAESLIAHDLPIIPLYHFNLTYLQHERLENVSISPLGLTDFRYAYFKEL